MCALVFILFYSFDVIIIGILYKADYLILMKHVLVEKKKDEVFITLERFNERAETWTFVIKNFIFSKKNDS